MTNKPRTLLDSLSVALNDKYCPVTEKAFKDKRFDARKFVFTDDVAMMMANLLKDHPNTFVDNLQFALPPYHVTYIEFPVGKFLDTLGARRAHEKWQMSGDEGHLWDDTKDVTAGYLIVGRTVYLMTKLNNGDIAFAPMVYKMHFEGTDEPLSFKGLRPMAWGHSDGIGDAPIEAQLEDGYVDSFNNLAQALGSVIANPKLELSQEHAKFLLMNYTCCDEVAFDLVKFGGIRFRGQPGHVREDSAKNLQMLMEGSMGEIRNILMCLLWLNQPRLIDIKSVPPSKGYFNGKFRAYSSYNLVDIRKELTVRKAVGVFREHSRHRRHEVQAYFRNFDKHPGCEHAWPLYPDADGRWTCPTCGQWRIRVKEHVRGDASLGWVNKDYLVK